MRHGSRVAAADFQWLGFHAGAQAAQTHLPGSSTQFACSLMSIVACLHVERLAECAVGAWGGGRAELTLLALGAGSDAWLGSGGQAGSSRGRQAALTQVH